MPLSMYQASIPVLVRYLNNLSAILKKGESFAAAKKIEPGVLINARLAPDMHPLSRQVQIASDVAKSGVARLAGVEVPSFKDEEKTFDELQERIAKTLSFIQGIQSEQIDGSETRKVSFKLRGNDVTFEGQPYLLNFILPNLFFHVTTTYAILRHNGVDLGKADYIGGF